MSDSRVRELHEMAAGLLREIRTLEEMLSSARSFPEARNTTVECLHELIQKKFAILEAIDGHRLDILDAEDEA